MFLVVWFGLRAVETPCSKSYVGETGWLFNTPLNEQQKENKLEAKPYTRQNRKPSVTETQKSAITDLVSDTNH